MNQAAQTRRRAGGTNGHRLAKKTQALLDLAETPLRDMAGERQQLPVERIVRLEIARELPRRAATSLFAACTRQRDHNILRFGCISHVLDGLDRVGRAGQ